MTLLKIIFMPVCVTVFVSHLLN